MIDPWKEQEKGELVILAFPHEGGYKIHCPYCGKWHLHGAQDGYRIAHCDGNRGYVIKRVNGKDYYEVKSGVALEEKIRKKQRSRKK